MARQVTAAGDSGRTSIIPVDDSCSKCAGFDILRNSRKKASAPCGPAIQHLHALSGSCRQEFCMACTTERKPKSNSAKSSSIADILVSIAPDSPPIPPNELAFIVAVVHVAFLAKVCEDLESGDALSSGNSKGADWDTYLGSVLKRNCTGVSNIIRQCANPLRGSLHLFMPQLLHIIFPTAHPTLKSIVTTGIDDLATVLFSVVAMWVDACEDDKTRGSSIAGVAVSGSEDLPSTTKKEAVLRSYCCCLHPAPNLSLIPVPTPCLQAIYNLFVTFASRKSPAATAETSNCAAPASRATMYSPIDCKVVPQLHVSRSMYLQCDYAGILRPLCSTRDVCAGRLRPWSVSARQTSVDTKVFSMLACGGVEPLDARIRLSEGAESPSNKLFPSGDIARSAAAKPPSDPSFTLLDAACLCLPLVPRAHVALHLSSSGLHPPHVCGTVDAYLDPSVPFEPHSHSQPCSASCAAVFLLVDLLAVLTGSPDVKCPELTGFTPISLTSLKFVLKTLTVVRRGSPSGSPATADAPSHLSSAVSSSKSTLEKCSTLKESISSMSDARAPRHSIFPPKTQQESKEKGKGKKKGKGRDKVASIVASSLASARTVYCNSPCSPSMNLTATRCSSNSREEGEDICRVETSVEASTLLERNNQPPPVKNWCVEDVIRWTQTLGLSADYSLFIRVRRITGKDLLAALVTAESWFAVGVAVMGDAILLATRPRVLVDQPVCNAVSHLADASETFSVVSDNVCRGDEVAAPLLQTSGSVRFESSASLAHQSLDFLPSGSPAQSRRQSLDMDAARFKNLRSIVGSFFEQRTLRPTDGSSKSSSIGSYVNGAPAGTHVVPQGDLSYTVPQISATLDTSYGEVQVPIHDGTKRGEIPRSFQQTQLPKSLERRFSNDVQEQPAANAAVQKSAELFVPLGVPRQSRSPTVSIRTRQNSAANRNAVSGPF